MNGAGYNSAPFAFCELRVLGYFLPFGLMFMIFYVFAQ